MEVKPLFFNNMTDTLARFYHKNEEYGEPVRIASTASSNSWFLSCLIVEDSLLTFWGTEAIKLGTISSAKQATEFPEPQTALFPGHLQEREI
jgi:hypothetical protein